MARFRYIEGVFRERCRKWGYEEVRTPTLEYLHLFTAAGTLTPSMLGQVYSFLDWDGWSGERVVLRPDGTIPAARLYVERLTSLSTARLFYVENVFAFEGTGQETRERWQCGAELIGSAKPEVDAELMLLALEALEGLGIEAVEIRLSHAGVIRGLVHGLGLTPEEQSVLLDQILGGDAQVLSEVKGRFPQLERALNLVFGIKGGSLALVRNLRGPLGSFPVALSALGDLARIVELLSALDKSFSIDFASARGFEYYTGIVFQFYSSNRRIGGGGRYDELIPLIGGGSIPACGFALYLDELMDLARLGESETAPSQRALFKSKTSAVEVLTAIFALACSLRDRGYIAELDVGQGESGFRWIISAEGERGAPLFHLLDQSSGKRVEGISAAELLRYLEGGR
jgi:histidyl-tRNA synthetase